MKFKFRGYSEVYLKWLYGNLVQVGDTFYIFPDGSLKKDGHHVHQDDGAYLVKAETIGQYTGSKDKNGQEIYAGDKYQPDYSEGDEQFVVVWDDKTASFKVHHYGNSEEYNGLYSEVQPFSELLDIDEFFDEAIVGNIHEEGKSQEITKQHEPRQ